MVQYDMAFNVGGIDMCTVFLLIVSPSLRVDAMGQGHLGTQQDSLPKINLEVTRISLLLILNINLC
jgi:hypothetical protein